MPALAMLHQFAGRKLPADLCEATTVHHGRHRRGALTILFLSSASLSIARRSE